MKAPRAHARGLTLIELTIALAVAAMVTAVGVISINALTHASLKSTAIELAGAIKYNYDRSIMEKRVQRIGMDLDQNVWWVEYTDDPYSLASERLRGTEGAKRDEEEEDDDDFDSFFGEADSEVKAALEGGRAASFVPDPDSGEPRPLPGDVRFSRVHTGHQEEPFESGIAYLHFFRGGWTEPAQIEITDGEDHITLKVAPLTGRVRTYHKQLEEMELNEWTGREEGDL